MEVTFVMTCTRLCSDHFARDSYELDGMVDACEISVGSQGLPRYPEGTCATLASLATTSKNLGPPSVPMTWPWCQCAWNRHSLPCPCPFYWRWYTKQSSSHCSQKNGDKEGKQNSCYHFCTV
jgi:hypothetical protein